MGWVKVCIAVSEGSGAGIGCQDHCTIHLMLWDLLAMGCLGCCRWYLSFGFHVRRDRIARWHHTRKQKSVTKVESKRLALILSGIEFFPKPSHSDHSRLFLFVSLTNNISKCLQFLETKAQWNSANISARSRPLLPSWTVESPWLPLDVYIIVSIVVTPARDMLASSCFSWAWMVQPLINSPPRKLQPTWLSCSYHLSTGGSPTLAKKCWNYRTLK